MTVTNEQVFILRREKGRGASQSVAAARAGMSRQTAAKYLESNKLPSELKKPRDWRTRINSFRDVWDEIEEMLRSQPGFHTKTVFEELCERHPGKFQPGQIRTLQRQVKQWRALHGDDSTYEVFFPQQHRAGEAAQTDFTHIGELQIAVGDAEYKPLLCHVVLPYSGWQWATPCRSESLMALRKGIQDAFFRLGRVPIWHQTDNSTAATHGIHTKGRRFNQSYLDLMGHLDMKPRVIGVGKKEQNGSVEAYNGALKRLLDQQLMRRGSRAFDTEVEFAVWLHTVPDHANAGRGKRFDTEFAVMRELKATRVPEFSEIYCCA